jgi:hypothetical protein
MCSFTSVIKLFRVAITLIESLSVMFSETELYANRNEHLYEEK